MARIDRVNEIDPRPYVACLRQSDPSMSINLVTLRQQIGNKWMSAHVRGRHSAMETDRRPFYPKKRMILMCDFDRGGFTAPEMVKRRRVVVLRVFSRIALVVPLSATEPRRPQLYHAAIGPGDYHSVTVPVGIKADTLAHVSLDRLDRVDVDGKYHTERVSDGDFTRVLVAAAHATGTMGLTVAAR